MRFKSFSLANYGCFEAVRLCLDPQPGHINLVVAPNGGGKTVLRRGFRDLLFGIPGQTAMAFRFGYPGMRITAEATDSEGASIAIGRRKGVGNTLVDGDGNTLDPAVLKRLIGEADDSLFERLFGLDSHLLRSGADAILASGGDIAEALFAAGSGVAGVRRMLTEFETLRDQLAPERRVAARPFYQAIAALTEARSDLRASTVAPQAWERLTAALGFTRDRRAALNTEQATDQAEIERLQRIKRVRPWLEQWSTAKRDCAVLADAPRLPADTDKRWRDGLQAAELARQEHCGAADRLAEITLALCAEEPDRRLLEEEDRIKDLERALGTIDSDHRDLPRREAERRMSLARLTGHLTALEVAPDRHREVVLPNGPRLAATRDLIKRHGVLAESLRSAREKVAQSERDITAAEAALAQVEEPTDTADLAAVAVEARAEGAPARRLAELEAQRSKSENGLAAAVAKLPLWRGDLASLTELIPPTRQAINRAAAALEAANAEASEAARELVRLRGERAELGVRLTRAREGKPVPDPAAVGAARAHRDRGWALIRRTRFDSQEAAAEVDAYSGTAGLATAFERATDHADHLADRRDEESRRLAQILELERVSAQRDREIVPTESRLAEAYASVERENGVWVALVENLGLSGNAEVGDLRDFLAARVTVLDHLTTRDAARQALAAEIERQEGLRRRFAKTLPADRCTSLSEALGSAQLAIDAGTTAKAQRDRRQTELDTHQGVHRQALAGLDIARRALEAWNAEWQEALRGLHRPREETPAAVEKAIELIEAARGERQHLDELDHRIAGMKQNIAEFGARVGKLVAAVASDLITESVEAAVRELRRRLATTKEIEARSLLLRNQQQTARADLTKAAGRRDGAEAALGSLRAAIGGESDNAIAERIALAASRSAAEAKLREVEAKLLEIGDGWPIDALERESTVLPAAHLETELARLQLETERITRDRETAAGEEQRLLNDVQRMEEAETAIDAAERRQAAIAATARISAEALTYHAAACLLRLGLESLKGSADGGLVQRLGATFARITGDAYAGVAADEDGAGIPFLVAIEADGTTAKRVGELSEGTRDQLFLALRLVMLEDYASKAPALPFIADDLLQTFDDYNRTAHALAALVDLSHHMQVIVLSHHRHLLQVTEALPAGTVNVCDLAA